MIWIKDRASAVVFLVAALALAACGGAGGEAGGEGGDASVQTRTVEHAMGEAKVEGTPDRVVVLDTGELDSAISLGVTPVEAVEGLGPPSYLEGTGEVENVGTIEEPNLEKIATLKPDLILSSKLRHDRLYRDHGRHLEEELREARRGHEQERPGEEGNGRLREPPGAVQERAGRPAG